MVNTSVFCTNSAPPEARFEAWRESVGVIYEVSREGAPQRPAFHARVESLIIDGILLNRCTAGGQSFARPAARCATDWHDHSLALKARMVIGQNLHVRELTPQMIASALNVSRARLYRAFRDIGGVNETIREMRLRRCFSELVSPANTHRPVADIADQWGFTDPSHFARVFRSRFGVTASDVRARHALNTMMPVAPDGPDRSYEAWIASIG